MVGFPGFTLNRALRIIPLSLALNIFTYFATLYTISIGGYLLAGTSAYVMSLATLSVLGRKDYRLGWLPAAMGTLAWLIFMLYLSQMVNAPHLSGLLFLMWQLGVGAAILFQTSLILPDVQPKQRVQVGTLIFGVSGIFSIFVYLAEIPRPWGLILTPAPGLLFGLGIWVVSWQDWKGRIGVLSGWLALSMALYWVALMGTTWFGFGMREVPGYFFAPLMALLTGLIACRMAFRDYLTPILPWVAAGLLAWSLACVPIFLKWIPLGFGNGLMMIFPLWQIGVGLLFLLRREKKIAQTANS